MLTASRTSSVHRRQYKSAAYVFPPPRSDRFLSCTLILALLLPGLFFERQANASTITTNAVRDRLRLPVNAAPEPFILAGSRTGLGSLYSEARAFAASSLATAVSAASRFADPMRSAPGFRPGPMRSAPPSPALPTASGSVSFDFDGDGKADIGRWRPAMGQVGGEFKVKNSSSGTFSTETIGTSGARVTPGDFDGDGKTDVAVFNAGTWTIKNSSNGATQTISFGASGDLPFCGDFDGDGKSDLSVVRHSTNTWWVRQSSDGSIIPHGVVDTYDVGVAGDYDGDASTDIAVYRPANGLWTIYKSSGGTQTYTWGTGSDIPVPSDYDGDGKTDVAVYRRTTGTWYVIGSTAGQFTQVWGNYGDQPAPADYDGDGKADFTIWRPTTGTWYTIRSATQTFDIQPLGVAGDTAVPSAYIRQIGGTVSPFELAQSRLTPTNATGGTDLYSQNFSWGTSLVGLPGRAGLDAGLGISYNSLVWTKSGSEIHFDTDVGNVGPGFRLGFPTIEPAYLDGKTGNFAYLMVTPSGARVEFRQVGAGHVYETADSSYAQLTTPAGTAPTDPVENLTLTVISTDGTQMAYAWKGGAFRCSQVKDRNGNYISISHNDDGQLLSVRDTLGRVITVEYADGSPSKIKQAWGTGTNGSGALETNPVEFHVWATFTYTNVTVNTDFDGSLFVVGPPNGTVVRMLRNVTYADGSSTQFDYNGYGQVYKISNTAADAHVLNYVRTNLQTPSSNQFDCPRFALTYNWAENFNGGSETVTWTSKTAGQSYTLGDGTTGTGTKIDVWMENDPNVAIKRSFVGESGWKEGLTLAAEDWNETGAGWQRNRWTRTDYTQDDTGLSYIKNPRVTETRVGDTGNTKKTTIEYAAGYGLPTKVEVGDLSTVYKRVETTYNLSPTYVNKSIIGLPSEVRSYGLEGASLLLVSKVDYMYDEDDDGVLNDSGLSQNISPTQHDDANYGSTFVAGRGNLTSTTVWNVDPAHSSESMTASVKYNTAGSPVLRTDAGGRSVKIGYSDSFNSTVSQSTYAYPTRLTEVANTNTANNYSEVQYRFDIGANVWARNPRPGGSTSGKETTREYDSAGRLEKESIVGGPYAKYSRPSPDNGKQLFTATTLIDKDGDGADPADEVTTETLLDGAGRVRMTRSPHTFDTYGNTTTWAATVTEYDILGRVARLSVPTEVNSSWAAAGDDATRGFLWTYQKYDWKGRVVRKINTDGVDQTTLNDSDVLISYEGCGCAGGQVTTVQTELVPRDDNPGLSARRTQKVYEDILGRTYKAVQMKWDGTTPYSTTEYTFNGRDQVTNTKQTDNISTATPQTHQDTTTIYDGFGRPSSSHKPEQQTSTGSPAYTTYGYNADGSLHTVTDARGAVKTLSYNTRGLLEGIGWSVPQNSTIPVPAPVAFGYDDLGNRSSMTDGLGSVSYSYDKLSRMTSEERDFTDTLSEAPPAGTYKLSYSYTLSGGLKSLTDPFGQQFNYSHDKVGRLQTVSGSTSFAGITTYASNPSYNARGTLTGLSYSNGVTMAITGFNNKLQANAFEIKKGTDFYIKKAYDFYADGSLKFVDDQIDDTFDRLYKYDFLGRTTHGSAGAAARGQTSASPYFFDQPYTRNYSYDAFGHIAGMSGYFYSTPDNISHAYLNDRNPNWSYDEEGDTISDADASYEFDAAGHVTKTTEWNLDDPTQPYPPTADYFDGGGQLAKRVSNSGSTTPAPQTSYYIRSSVLGSKVVSEVTATGAKAKTFVLANGATLAEQDAWVTGGTPHEALKFVHQDPSGASVRASEADGTLLDGSGDAVGEYDPMGRNIADAGPYTTLDSTPPPDENGIDLFGSGGGYRPGRNSYAVDGLPVTEDYFMSIIDSGLIGGAFGLLELTARISRGTYLDTTYSVASSFGVQPFGSDSAGAVGWWSETHGQLNLTNNYLVNVLDNTWSIVGSLIPIMRQGNSPVENKLTDKTIEKARSIATQALKKRDCRKLFEILGLVVQKSDSVWDSGITRIGLKDTNPGRLLSKTDILFRQQDQDVLRADPSTSWIAHAVVFEDDPFYIADGKKYRVGNTILLSEAATAGRPNVSFEDPASVDKVQRLTDGQVRALVLLHELMHLTFQQGHNGASSSDAAWNDRILKNCF